MYTKEQLAAWDRQYIWHPFTQMKDYMKDEPLIIERGEGSFLIDVDGNRYIDGVSSLWVLIHGHGRRELVDAIHVQAESLCHSTLLGLATTPSILLAKKLTEITPRGLTKGLLLRQRFHLGRDRPQDGVPVLAAEGRAAEAAFPDL